MFNQPDSYTAGMEPTSGIIRGNPQLFTPLFKEFLGYTFLGSKGQRIGLMGWRGFCCLSSLPTSLSFTSGISPGKTESGFHQPGENYKEERFIHQSLVQSQVQ